MTHRTISPVALAEAAIVAIVALWLVNGLASTPAALGLVVVFAAIPLLVVVLPALAVRAVGDDGRVHLRLRLPVRARREREDPIAVTDGGRPDSKN